MSISEVTVLLQRIRKFVTDRDWERYHSPKNLSMALASETGELLHILRWLTEDESQKLSTADRERVSDEISDIVINLFNLSDKLGVDPIALALDKLDKLEKKYPVNF